MALAQCAKRGRVSYASTMVLEEGQVNNCTYSNAEIGTAADVSEAMHYSCNFASCETWGNCSQSSNGVCCFTPLQFSSIGP